jgi:hypothetical protein
LNAALSVQDLIHALRLLPTGNNNSEEEEMRDVDMMANLHSGDQHEQDRESQVQKERDWHPFAILIFSCN